MTIGQIKAVAFFESFVDPKTFTIDVGTGANRKARILAGRDHGTPAVVSIGVGTDTLTLVGAAVQGPGTAAGKFYCYEGDLTVTGSQTVTIDYNDNSGGAWGVIQVYQGTGTLTFGAPTWVDAESGSSGSISGSVAAATSDKVSLLLVEGGGLSPTLTPTSPATQSSDLGTTGYLSLIRDGLSGATSIGASASVGYGVIGFAFTISEAGAAPVLTGNITEDEDAPTGSLAPAAPSSITGSITEDDDLPTGNLGAVAGTINIGPWKSDVGMPLPSTTIPKLTFLRDSDGLQVLTLLNQVTSASPTAPMIPVTNGALVPGLKYWVASWDAAGVNYGFEPYTAA